MNNSIYKTMIRPYPPITPGFLSEEDINPAIQLFGSRLFSDQTVLEFLVELLLVAYSPKKIMDMKPFNKVFPDRDILQNWDKNKRLLYAPPARLNLKLFSFIGASKLETRHESHKKHYKDILNELRNRIDSDSPGEEDDILRTIENLFLGFQGAGYDRTWCAQTFVPISFALLSAETLWNQSLTKDTNNLDWHIITDRFRHFFSVSRHRFLARGGELLYLQLCNALRQSSGEIDSLSRRLGISLNEIEADSVKLYEALGDAFNTIMAHCPPALDKIALLIDKIDGETVQRTDGETDSERFTNCGWCPEDSWMEGYLFAVEFLRVCQAEMDPIERIEMLKLCCAFQVLRSLCAQSARVVPWSKERLSNGNGLGFIWAISSSSGEDSIIKQVSQRNLKAIQQLIYNAIRIPEIKGNVDKYYRKTSTQSLYREADTRYGDRFFLSLSKKIGFVVPKKGPGARFVLSDHIIRYLVLALIRPGERCTLDTFKGLMFAHYGLAIDGKYIQKACAWSDYPSLSESETGNDDWLVQKLRASGFLIHLSDACSLVQNPFGNQRG